MTGTVGRVALVAMHTPPAQQAGTGDSGGLNVSLLATAHELAKRGVEVELLTRASGPPSVTLLEPGVSIHALPAGPPAPVDKSRLRALTDEFGESVARLAGRIAPRYDVIHAHYWLSGIATLPVSLELGVPFVQSFHTLAAMKNRHLATGQDPEPELRLRSEGYLASQASAVVAGSVAEVGCLIDELHAPAERVWVIPPGVDVSLFTPDRAAAGKVRREYSIEEGRPVLAVVGRVQPLKDQELAVRTLAALRRRRGWTPVLVIAGESTPGDEPYLESLRSLATRLGVEDDVRFVGALERQPLADLLAVATVTLVPSHSETFGLVALESAASGTPVVGYRSTGLMESIAEGESGVLLDSRDPEDWAAAVGSLLDDQAARERLSRRAREHALGFTWGTNATALLALYAALAGPGAA
ncbi:glycosyltransferase [Salinibacterium sp. dk2585]|uniref:glycosyltransferase n=1 Tax=unclassified Salinibacterium TaxID=2632331 RepID=UPI0011C248C6|nr:MULTISPECIES: glycosyltransferase [unclassified Salinibacterium]QEE61780.1 glycosyltransferase [Salinibacterium sp. dk2585]TXK54665.1 glycosyltransferase [Salinibacterium sp. dk5596]